ncbi:hypothetical protein E2542_SST13533 [Spatholobus suberectus]|nr:hypothetical protein E2542_SST13533 [Spatholobus suberectus]
MHGLGVTLFLGYIDMLRELGHFLQDSYGVLGMNSKGRIFGLGSEAGKYKPSSSSISFDGISLSEYEQMRSLVSKVTEENKNLKEQLQTHLKMIRASQEESRLFREQMTRFMESFSLGCASQLVQCGPEPSTDDQDNQQDYNELDDNVDV